MTTTGLLLKMITELGSPIQYYLKLGEELISVNQLLGKKIKIQFNHYQCLECGQEKETLHRTLRERG